MTHVETGLFPTTVKHHVLVLVGSIGIQMIVFLGVIIWTVLNTQQFITTLMVTAKQLVTLIDQTLNSQERSGVFPHNNILL